MSYLALPHGARPSRMVGSGRLFTGSRAILTRANLTRDEDGWKLVTTDSYGLAVLPLVVEHDDDEFELTEGLISVESLRAIEKAGGRFRAHESVEPLDKFGRPTGQMFARPLAGGEPQFPSHKRLIDDASGGEFRITLNARLLFSLAQALGDDRVTLSISQHQKRPVHVETFRTNDDAHGLIMPIVTQ